MTRDDCAVRAAPFQTESELATMRVISGLENYLADVMNVEEETRGTFVWTGWIRAMKTIYIVTSGEYSAYSIDAVFSTRELAQRFIVSLGTPQGYDEKMRIEEWELDKNETHLREGYSPYYVEMYRDGTVKTVRISYRGWEAEFGRRINDERDDGELTGKTILDITCKAKDEAHAVKIANDNRSQLIASGEWKPDERQVTT